MTTCKWIFSLAVGLSVSTTSFAQSSGGSFADHVLREIICQYPPDPTPTLFYLSKRKHVDLKRGERADGETCWIMRPPLDVAGVTFTHVCAASEDPLLIELFPLLYYRGPGTSPGTGLRLVTNEDEAAVDEWIERGRNRLGIKADTKLDIGEPTFVKGKTEISCNSMSFLPKE